MAEMRFVGMPRFHLNLFNDVDALDEEGTEFVDLAAAKELAIAAARELMAAHVLAGKPVSLWHRIEIADDAGKVLATLPFAELITINAKAPIAGAQTNPD